MVVPADFGDNEIHWTLTFRGDTQTIPGHMHRDWMLDALGGGAGGDAPPVVSFTENGYIRISQLTNCADEAVS